jgi:hypothetical protein
MATQVTVNDITGITPYNIYLCDSAGGTCIYINEIESGDLPYNFLVPPQFAGQPQYLIKIIDGVGCTITNLFDIN